MHGGCSDETYSIRANYNPIILILAVHFNNIRITTKCLLRNLSRLPLHFTSINKFLRATYSLHIFNLQNFLSCSLLSYCSLLFSRRIETSYFPIQNSRCTVSWVSPKQVLNIVLFLIFHLVWLVSRLSCDRGNWDRCWWRGLLNRDAFKGGGQG